MKDNRDTTSEGLNQIFELINAKGDTGELNEILNRYQTEKKEQQDER